MSTTVTYKGNTIATLTNQTRTLTTAGTWLDANIVVTDTSSTSALTVTDTTDAAGGTIRTISAVDISDTTAVASDVASGKYFYTANGTKTLGTATGGSGTTPTLITKNISANGTYNAISDSADGYSTVVVNVSGGGSSPSATPHSIYLEFSDNTNATIPVYYNDAFISTIITSSKPTAYNLKEITLAQLDNVTWYEPTQIPLNTELVDYTKCTEGYAIDDLGNLESQQWSWATDYIPIASGMTFTYTAYYWFYIGLYDESKNFLMSIYVMNDATVDPNDGNTGHGTLSGNKLPATVAYARLCGADARSDYISLIRTA